MKNKLLLIISLLLSITIIGNVNAISDEDIGSPIIMYSSPESNAYITLTLGNSSVKGISAQETNTKLKNTENVQDYIVYDLKVLDSKNEETKLDTKTTIDIRIPKTYTDSNVEVRYINGDKEETISHTIKKYTEGSYAQIETINTGKYAIVNKSNPKIESDYITISGTKENLDGIAKVTSKIVNKNVDISGLKKLVKSYTVYEVSLQDKDGKEVQPKGIISLDIIRPEEYKAENASVFPLVDDKISSFSKNSGITSSNASDFISVNTDKVDKYILVVDYILDTDRKIIESDYINIEGLEKDIYNVSKITSKEVDKQIENLDDSRYTVYEINLYDKNGKEVQLSGNFRISVKIPDKYYLNTTLYTIADDKLLQLQNTGSTASDTLVSEVTKINKYYIVLEELSDGYKQLTSTYADIIGSIQNLENISKIESEIDNNTLSEKNESLLSKYVVYDIRAYDYDNKTTELKNKIELNLKKPEWFEDDRNYAVYRIENDELVEFEDAAWNTSNYISLTTNSLGKFILAKKAESRNFASDYAKVDGNEKTLKNVTKFSSKKVDTKIKTDKKIKKYQAYEIELSNENRNELEPNGKVKLSLKIPEGYDKNRLAVYRVDGNNLVGYNVTVDGDYAIIETDHFSTYIVAEEDVVNPKTGAFITYSILGLLLIVSVTYIIKKIYSKKIYKI